jgi:hypothetical protein
VPLRELEAGLARGVLSRRGLLREAAGLSHALLGTSAPRAMLRRYARALARFGVNAAAPTGDLPAMLLSALDTPRARAGGGIGSLGWRFGVVARLAESEPSLAGAFIMREGHAGRARALAALLRAGLLEMRNLALYPVARAWTVLQR